MSNEVIIAITLQETREVIVTVYYLCSCPWQLYINSKSDLRLPWQSRLPHIHRHLPRVTICLPSANCVVIVCNSFKTNLQQYTISTESFNYTQPQKKKNIRFYPLLRDEVRRMSLVSRSYIPFSLFYLLTNTFYSVCSHNLRVTCACTE